MSNSAIYSLAGFVVERVKQQKPFSLPLLRGYELNLLLRYLEVLDK